MAAIPLPDRGQPLDISYLLTMANEINKMNSIVSAKKTESSIKYSSTTNNSIPSIIATSDVIFYAESQNITLTSTNSTTTFVFRDSFKFTPIITTSIEMSGQTIGVFPVITSSSNTSCTIKLYATGTISSNIPVTVSIIAIGERP